MGEVAWASRHMTTANETIPCYKMKADAPRAYASPAELKAAGHLKRVATPASKDCCDSLSCPMRKAV